MKLRLPSGLFSSDIGIDLGTANTLLFVRGQGIVVSEPSIVALDRVRHTVIAVGQAAQAMLGRTPGNIEVIRPLRNGVIADFEVAQTLLKELIGRVQPRSRLFRPRIVIGVSSCTTQVERRAVREAAMQAGAHAVFLVEEPMAAAIGAGLPIQEPGGHLVVDIGGGTTEVAVISLSGIVFCQSARTAGDDMNDAITQYIRKHYNLLVGERRVEEFKLALGTARAAGQGAAHGRGQGQRHRCPRAQDDHDQRGRGARSALRLRGHDCRDRAASASSASRPRSRPTWSTTASC